MGERMIRRQIGDSALHQLAARAHLVVVAHRVGGHRRIGDQPGLDISAPGPERGGSPDEAMHREPVKSFLHRAPPSFGCGSSLGSDHLESQHCATILKSVVTTLLGLLLLMPYALPVMVYASLVRSTCASPTPPCQKLPVKPSTLRIFTHCGITR